MTLKKLTEHFLITMPLQTTVLFFGYRRENNNHNKCNDLVAC